MLKGPPTMARTSMAFQPQKDLRSPGQLNLLQIFAVRIPHAKRAVSNRVRWAHRSEGLLTFREVGKTQVSGTKHVKCVFATIVQGPKRTTECTPDKAGLRAVRNVHQCPKSETVPGKAADVSRSNFATSRVLMEYCHSLNPYRPPPSATPKRLRGSSEGLLRMSSATTSRTQRLVVTYRAPGLALLMRARRTC
jgi:hypothetical protein